MSDYPIQPITFEKVAVTKGFWAERLETNRRSTLPACLKKCEETGRIHNFEVAGGLKDGGFQGIFFNDSDVFKIVEGAAYTLTMKPDPELEAYVDDLIAKFAAAQEDDGYLYTARTIGDPKYNYPGQEGRWSHCRDGHELYNVGHMYEGAVAHYQATGKRNFLDVAIKSADLVCEIFGEGEGQRIDVPGHEEIEIGLVKLYRVTGDKKYLDQANFFLEMRGRKDKRKELYGDNRQDQQPVKDQKEAVGHAVRAGYMYAGMADVAALTGDREMIDAADGIWENITSKKLYITGGVGGSRDGEAYAGNYELPNRTAYNETCAAIANVLFNHRMFLLHGDAKYMDVVERTIYNGFLSGVSLQGDTYFYPNPLSSDGRTKFNHDAGAERSPWFGCSCCPSNIVRFVPSIPGYMYATKDDSLYVNLFATGIAEVEVGGQKVKLTQQTKYPWQGRIELTIEPEAESEFILRVRVPGWARGAVAPGGLYQESGDRGQESGPRASLVAGCDESNVPIDAASLENGYLVIKRKWAKGDTVVLDLPMDIRRVVCDEKVEANRGRVAFERGPLVYCAEGADHDGHALNLWVPDAAVLEAKQRDDLPGKPLALQGKAQAAVRDEDGSVTSHETDLTLIPYYAWCHRGPNEMRVWLPRDEGGVLV